MRENSIDDIHLLDILRFFWRLRFALVWGAFISSSIWVFEVFSDRLTMPTLISIPYEIGVKSEQKEATQEKIQDFLDKNSEILNQKLGLKEQIFELSSSKELNFLLVKTSALESTIDSNSVTDFIKQLNVSIDNRNQLIEKSIEEKGSYLHQDIYDFASQFEDQYFTFLEKNSESLTKNRADIFAILKELNVDIPPFSSRVNPKKEMLNSSIFFIETSVIENALYVLSSKKELKLIDANKYEDYKKKLIVAQVELEKIRFKSQLSISMYSDVKEKLENIESTLRKIALDKSNLFSKLDTEDFTISSRKKIGSLTKMDVKRFIILLFSITFISASIQILFTYTRKNWNYITS